MRRPRIGVLMSQMAIGGDENRVLYLARHLDRQRFDLRIYVLVRPTAAAAARHGPIADRYAGLPVIVLDEPARGEKVLSPAVRLASDAWQLARVLARLGARFRADGIDLIDARMGPAAVLGVPLARLLGIPVVSTEYFSEFWDATPWRQLAPVLWRGLDATITDSAACRTALRRQIGVPVRRFEVIPNGIPEPERPLDRAQARQLLGLPEAARVVTQVSRLVAYKGHDVLIAAAGRVLPARPDVHLLICGYPGRNEGYLQELQTAARETGVGDRIHFRHHAGPIGEVWAATDVHAHASRMDSSPIAIHESMACGLPAVVSDCGGIPELVAHGESGLVVRTGDAEAFAGALASVLDDPALAAALGQAARRRYLARHQPETMVRAIEQVYVDVLAAGHPRARRPVED